MTARRADLLLLTATLIWGVSFVVVKEALADATPLAFVALRFTVAAVVFAPFARLGRPFAPGELAWGLVLAVQLAVGFAAQTIGLVWTTPARSAFIVSISSVLAPLFAVVLVRERPRWLLVAAIALAAAGTYYLTAPEAGGLNRGDLWTLVTAVVFGAQIVTVSALSRRYDPLRLVWLQVAGTAALGLAGAWLVEDVAIRWTPRFAGALLFAALFPTVVALWLQILAQRHMSSARAALLFCFEALVAATTSWLVLGERLSSLQWLGGGLILAGMVLAELPRSRQPAAVSHQATDSG